MKTISQTTLSTTRIRTRDKTGRPTPRTMHILTFIHRFRHVTTRHLQLSLGHASFTTSFKQLMLLCTKGYIARQYNDTDRASNRSASYFLTKEGLTLLRQQNPTKSYRSA